MHAAEDEWPAESQSCIWLNMSFMNKCWLEPVWPAISQQRPSPPTSEPRPLHYTQKGRCRDVVFFFFFFSLNGRKTFTRDEGKSKYQEKVWNLRHIPRVPWEMEDPVFCGMTQNRLRPRVTEPLVVLLHRFWLLFSFFKLSIRCLWLFWIQTLTLKCTSQFCFFFVVFFF